MIYWSNYKGHNPDIVGKRKLIDNTIYTFDIETTSIIDLHGKIMHGCEYENLTKDEQEECEFYGFMYIWMFSINDIVYYGRTWDEFKIFIDNVQKFSSEHKIIFVHNLPFEFQFLKCNFNFKNILARKSHKVMKCEFEDYDIEWRCSLFMSNCKLSLLPKIYNLPVEKLVGELDYKKIRNSKTKLTKEELNYCKNDCLVVYYYILEELKTYKQVNKIPYTSTGHVRRELKELVRTDYKYKRLINRAINTDPHIYNLLIQAFMGGYTHANWIYTNEIVKNIDSWDFTSSYPYILATHKFPSTEFKKCNIKSRDEMIRNFAYLFVVKFKNIQSKYYNNFISYSKCRNCRGVKVDNGRIIRAEEIEMTLTDIDFLLILDSYSCEYEIIESYYSCYNYLPKVFIEFVLEKYVLKTQYKNVVGKEVEYAKEKNKFNALYGMSVTNMIRDDVIFENSTGLWSEIPLTNNEIIEKLQEEKEKSFLSFAFGVWVTANARNNLLRNLMKLDEFTVYADTDSLKLLPRI